MPGIENVDTIWDFMLLMIQGFSIFFVWWALGTWIDKHQNEIKERLRNPDDEENNGINVYFGVRFGTIIRNIGYVFLITCALYITITIIQASEF